MRSVLFVLAVIAVCVAYEFDRAASFAPAWQLAPARVYPDHAGVAPFGLAGPAAPPGGLAEGATGSVEREHSIRLFGPGVSRQRQIRV